MDSMEMDDIATKVDCERRKQPSRCVSVCLGLLCAVLLAGNIGQFIYYKIISRESADPTQASFQFQVGRLQDGYEASTAERQQLEAKQSYTALTTERDEFKASFNNLTNENNQLQASSYTLKQVSDQLQTSYNNMQKSLEGLQANHNNLTASKDQLQTNNRDLQRENDECQNKYNSLVKVKDELEKNINKLRADRPCETGWIKFEKNCYFFSTEEKNWASSREDCIAKGADLVVINSRAEQVFINGLLPPGKNIQAWIGMTDSVRERTWMWVDGTPVITTYWESRQPNDFDGAQDCGETTEKAPGEGVWNDEGCNEIQRFICEQ